MEPSPSLELVRHVLLAFGIILAVGTACSVLAQKLRIPDVVIFLVVGLLLGPDVMGIINIRVESALNQLVMIFGSCYLLFDGGASLRFNVLKNVWITIVSLATVGVLITAFITSLAAYYILDVPYLVALLLGTIIASTDPATLIPVFRQIKIRDRVAQTVMSESAFNDAVGAIIAFSVLKVAMGHGDFSISIALKDLFKQTFFGVITGGVLGYLAAFSIAHEKYGFLQKYAPVVSLMAVIGAYLGADGLHASGFMTVFVFGIVIGNKGAFGFKMEREEQEKLADYVMTTALIMRMFIFILLGTQVNFALMGRYLFGGVAVVTVFMLLARPMTVFICALPDRRAKWSLKELLFMCWTRETGVIPGALAGLMVGIGAPEAKMIASVTFIAILMTIIIQATTTRWLANRLGLLEE
jgi:cell volume regulation protein A